MQNYNNFGTQNRGFYPQQKQYYNQPFQNQFQQPVQKPKRSGAIYTKINTGGAKDGFFMVNAWRMTKFGLMKATCSPLQDYDKNGNPLGVTKFTGKQKGNEFVKYKVVIEINGMTQKHYALMRLDTKVINLQELGLCITPNGSGYTSKGKHVKGYFGANYKRK